jgi:hypothetical protein
MQSSNVPNVWRPRPGSTANQPLDRLRRSTLSTEQSMFLKRFSDLVEKRRQNVGRFAESDWHRRLVDKALFSTYRDCLDLDVGEEARGILRRGQVTPAG